MPKNYCSLKNRNKERGKMKSLLMHKGMNKDYTLTLSDKDLLYFMFIHYGYRHHKMWKKN